MVWGFFVSWNLLITKLDSKNLFLITAREQHRRQLEQAVRDGLLKVLEAVNAPEVYTPSLGSSQAETEHIIDFDLPDISPYRFGISFTVSAS